MSDNSVSWNDVSPTIEQTEEQFFGEWLGLEQRFGEYGPPGFSEQIKPARFPAIFGHNGEVDVRFTLYRSEDGLLLGIHGCYLDEFDNNIQKPFHFMVHPDHQRQGIGTMMADYLRERFQRENGIDMTFEQSFRGTTYTIPGAGIVNKYVRNAYEQMNNGDTGV